MSYVVSLLISVMPEEVLSRELLLRPFAIVINQPKQLTINHQPSTINHQPSTINQHSECLLDVFAADERILFGEIVFESRRKLDH